MLIKHNSDPSMYKPLYANSLIYFLSHNPLKQVLLCHFTIEEATSEGMSG